jgi:hypothetical protein
MVVVNLRYELNDMETVLEFEEEIDDDPDATIEFIEEDLDDHLRLQSFT